MYILIIGVYLRIGTNITLHYITLHYITLHYIIGISNATT